MQIRSVELGTDSIKRGVVSVRYAVIGSGSNGNAYAFETDAYLLIIDAGFKAKLIYQRLQDLGFSLYKSSYILCTHTHHDHVSGVADLAVMLDAVVVGSGTLLTHLSLPASLDQWCVDVNAYYSLPIGSFCTFATSHDAAESLSYHLEIYGLYFMVLTDTGTILPAMYRLAFYSHVLFLEANYDEQMLLTGSYPPFLKQRVSGNKGHLSNKQSKEFLMRIKKTRHLRQVFFCHISDQNNDTTIVEEELIKGCHWSWQSYVCKRAKSSELFIVEL